MADALTALSTTERLRSLLDEARQALVFGDAVLRMVAENDALRAENERLRAVAASVACALESSRRPALAERLRAALEVPRG